MAVDATIRTAAHPGASCAPTNGRGRPAMVVLRATTALAPLLEAQALAHDAIDSAERIQTAAACGSRQLIAFEAGRLGHRATVALAEFRAAVELVERRP